MRTLCDACESAFAIVFCAADEAALCLACDKKVHMCNKLASRHVRVAFFYCETDGSSLCLQCDMTVHVGGKRTHGRYLLLRQKIEFPGDQPQPEDPAPQPMYPGETRRGQNRPQKATAGENRQNRQVSPVLMSVTNSDGHEKVDKKMIDLNMKPHRIHEHASNSQPWEKLKLVWTKSSGHVTVSVDDKDYRSSPLINSKACLCEGPGFDPQEYQPVTPAVSYLPTGLAGCSVGPGNSRGARKLARTPRLLSTWAERGEISPGWSLPNTYMDKITPRGWTVFYGQYRCSGPGSDSGGRVSWSRELTEEQALPFISISFIDGVNCFSIHKLSLIKP
uniref:B box-type domain-containing protein n=1 Tax=Populus alba TaxID=43335 RepID=A0A4U5PS90_POPAL|nr:hypothetical protein D5086_0000184510 [Populus alba]